MVALNSVPILELTEGDKPNEGPVLRKSTALLKLPCHLGSEKSNTSSPLISLSGPETAQALSQNLSRGQARATLHPSPQPVPQAFHFTGEARLQRPGPLTFHIHVPAPVI